MEDFSRKLTTEDVDRAFMSALDKLFEEGDHFAKDKDYVVGGNSRGSDEGGHNPKPRRGDLKEKPKCAKGQYYDEKKGKCVPVPTGSKIGDDGEPISVEKLEAQSSTDNVSGNVARRNLNAMPNELKASMAQKIISRGKS